MKYVYNVRFDFNAIILNHKIIKIVNKAQQLLYIARGYLITTEKKIYKLCCAENLVFLFSHFLGEQICLCKRKLFICIIARKNHYWTQNVHPFLVRLIMGREEGAALMQRKRMIKNDICTNSHFLFFFISFKINVRHCSPDLLYAVYLNLIDMSVLVSLFMLVVAV